LQKARYIQFFGGNVAALTQRQALNPDYAVAEFAEDARRTDTQTYFLYFKCPSTKQMRCPVNAYLFSFTDRTQFTLRHNTEKRIRIISKRIIIRKGANHES